MTHKKFLQLAIGLATSFLFIWLIFKSIPIDSVLKVIRSVKFDWLIVGLICLAAGYACRIRRWQLMLTVDNPNISWGRCAIPFMTSFAANNVLPFRAGDALRAVAFSKWLEVSTGKILATLIFERLIDLFVIFVALIISIMLLGGEEILQLFIKSCIWLIVVTVSFSIIFFFFHGSLKILLKKFLNLFYSETPKLIKTIIIQIQSIFKMLSNLTSHQNIYSLLSWSILAWGFEAYMFYAVALGVSDLIKPVAAFLAMPISTLSTMIPSSPGYIGTFHYFSMLAMESLGNTEVASAAFSFIVHLALYAPITLIGGACFCYWILKKPFRINSHS